MENKFERQDAIIATFDAEVGLCGVDVDNPHAYHTKIKKGRGHAYVTNAANAPLLLKGGREKDIEIAKIIIKKVIEGQCTTPGDTYGLWPYYYEESLEEMDMPDWNMADFNGIQLFSCMIEYGDCLDNVFRAMILESVRAACRCIINRDVHIGYTNVAIMDIFLTIAFGERFDEEILAFGLDKLRRLHHRIVEVKGYYDEYNSPTYSVVLVGELGRMLKYIKNEDALVKINELNNLAWKMIALHYHPGTGQWAGPQVRQYTRFITEKSRAYFEAACRNKIKLTDEVCESGDCVARCPEEYIPLFTDKNKSCDQILPMISNDNLTEICCIRPNYTLGTFNAGMAWNQRRNMLGYFGDKKETYCLWQRVLHDGYDYCSAFMQTVQKGSSALTMNMFYMQGGDTHMSLDMVENGTIRAKDMRVSYMFETNAEGALDKIGIEDNIEKDGTCRLDVAGQIVEIGFVAAEFDDFKPYMEIRKEKDFLSVDIVLYSGEEKELNFNEIKSAYSVSYITINNDNFEKPVCSVENEKIAAEWNVEGGNLKMLGTANPNKINWINYRIVGEYSSYIDGKLLEVDRREE